MIFAMEGQKSRQPCGTKTQVKTALDLQTKKRKEKRMTRPTAGGKIEELFFSVFGMKALNGKFSV
jgi:hypothetical protein